MGRTQLGRSKTKKKAADGDSGVRDSLAAFNVRMPKPTEVKAYLAPYGELRRLLPQICAALRGDFGPTVELSLERYADPEIDDSYLTLYVRNKEYDRQFVDRIAAISSRFDEHLSVIPGHLVITTDFRLPRGENAV